MTCKEFHELHDRPAADVTPAKRREFHEHARTCPECSRFMDETLGGWVPTKEHVDLARQLHDEERNLDA